MFGSISDVCTESNTTMEFKRRGSFPRLFFNHADSSSNCSFFIVVFIQDLVYYFTSLGLSGMFGIQYFKILIIPFIIMIVSSHLKYIYF